MDYAMDPELLAMEAELDQLKQWQQPERGLFGKNNLKGYMVGNLTGALAFEPPEQNSLQLPFVKAWVLIPAWCAFSLIMIATARYMRHQWTTNMVLHTAMGSFITF